MTLPRLLLFGSTGAGKSSLLGALAQAAQTQKTQLKGQLVAKTGDLDKIHKTTYDSAPDPTGQLDSYDIHIEPSDKADSTAKATLLDCNGVDALAMFNSATPFEDANPLQKPLLDADAILLLVDASLPPKKLDDEFRQFAEWLKEYHEARGSRTDVGGFPVYLVLTKCDLLAKPDDTFAKWLQRIEEGKRNIDQRFRVALKDQEAGFGSIDLRISATAIRRPALADRTAKSLEPFNVAELFRESMHAAADLQERRATSQHRLQNVLVGLVGIVIMLALAVTMLLIYQPESTLATLEDKAGKYVPRNDQPAAVRLGETLKNLEKKKTELDELTKDPGFANLPTETQESMTRYRDEIALYLELAEWAKTEVKFPFMAKTEEQFHTQKKGLDGFNYPDHFDSTRIGKHIQRARDEYVTIEREIKEEVNWLQAQTDASNKLYATGAELQFKLSKKQKLTEQEENQWKSDYLALTIPKPRVQRNGPIPGVSGVTYEFLDKFQAVQIARKNWDAAKGKLNRINQNIQDELR